MQLTPIFFFWIGKPNCLGLGMWSESLDLTFTPSLAHGSSDFLPWLLIKISWGALKSTDPQASQTLGRRMEPRHLCFLELPR